MHKKLLFGLIAAIAATNAYSDQVLTSQRYVDDADAQKVNIAQGVGTNNANVGKTLVVNSSGNLELGTVSADNFVEDSITDGVTNKAPSENAVHDALADKQDTIETGLVSLGDGWFEDLPAVASYDTTSGLVGNKYGILDYNGSAEYVDDGWNNYQEDDETNHLIPTVGAVGRELYYVRAAIPSVTPLTWDSTTDTAAVNNYSTTFNGTTNNWPTAQSGQYVRGAVLANALALKQNKIPASETTIHNGMTGQNQAAPSVVTNTATPGVVGQMAILTGSVYNSAAVDDDLSMDDFGNGTGDDMLVTAKAVINYVDGRVVKKQNKIPAGTAGNVVTYTGTAGTVGSVATANAPTYNATTGALTNGTSIATIAAVDTKQNKMTCTRWLNNIETDENCLLWELN